MLHSSCAAGSPVAHEPGCLVVPLAIEIVDGVLERSGGAVVVLGCHEYVGVERSNLFRPRFRVLPAVLAERRRHGLVEQREPVIRDVDQFELGVLALLRQAINPTRDRLVVATGPRTPGYDCNSRHILIFVRMLSPRALTACGRSDSMRTKMRICRVLQS